MKVSTNLERIADHAVTHSTDIQPKSITVTISGTLARELEEFRRIAMTTPDELVNDIVGEELGRDSDGVGRKGNFRGSLGRYINRQNYSQEQANKVPGIELNSYPEWHIIGAAGARGFYYLESSFPAVIDEYDEDRIYP